MTFDELMVVQAAAARLRGTAQGFDNACAKENPTSWFGRCCLLVIETLQSEAASLEEMMLHHDARESQKHGDT